MHGPLPCDQPASSPVSGLTSCANGLVHRTEAVACQIPDGSAGAPGEAPTEPMSCNTDEDCSAWPLGYCAEANPPFLGFARCFSGCLEDSDCNEDQLCACDGSATGGKCRDASCRVDADCGANSYCGRFETECGRTPVFRCTTPSTCFSDADCESNQICGANTCVPAGTGGAACGRPFLIENAPRFAEITARADWLDRSLSPSLSGLCPLQRAEFAAHWSRLGQMEHASIAAFARFNQQLLALGAPSDLVEACNQALIDETAHAKLCFAFASAYAGTKLGPGKLDMSHCFEETTLLSVTQLVISEGCIGETVAALEALEDADRAADPVVKNALLRIAHDERNHAELAYRFVRWAFGQCSEEERQALIFEAEQRTCAVEATRRIAIELVVRPLLSASLCDS